MFYDNNSKVIGTVVIIFNHWKTSYWSNNDVIAVLWYNKTYVNLLKLQLQFYQTHIFQ